MSYIYIYVCSYPPQRSTIFACLSDIFRYQMNLLDNFTDFREQAEHNFDHIVVFDWVLVKSLMGSNCFASPAPMMILLSLCFQ